MYVQHRPSYWEKARRSLLPTTYYSSEGYPVITVWLGITIRKHPLRGAASA